MIDLQNRRIVGRRLLATTAAVAGLVGAGIAPASASGGRAPGDFTVPCTGADAACLDLRLDAIEAWIKAQASPTPHAAEPPAQTPAAPVERPAPVEHPVIAPPAVTGVTAWDHPLDTPAAPEEPAPLPLPTHDYEEPSTPAPAPVTHPSPAANTHPATPETAPPVASESEELVRLVNLERTKRGLPALRVNQCATSRAQGWSEEMVRTGYRHSNIRETMDACDANSIGENIAWGQGTPDEVMEDWMNSPAHLANILSSRTDIGVGVARNANGQAFWTQMFLTNPQVP